MSEIIDFHVHPKYDFHYGDHGVSITDDIFKSDLNKCGITKCCGSVITLKTSYLPFESYPENIVKLNDTAFSLREKWNDFYYPGIHVHPSDPELSFKEIDRALQKGFRLIGELVPGMMSFNDYTRKEFMEILAYAENKDTVVCMHPTNPEDMFTISKNFPKLKLVWAHLSSYGNFKHHIELLKKFENVWFDTSAYGLCLNSSLRFTIDKVGYERILFGTDYPGANPASDIAAIYYENLSYTERSAIFFKNAKRLLGL